MIAYAMRIYRICDDERVLTVSSRSASVKWILTRIIPQTPDCITDMVGLQYKPGVADGMQSIPPAEYYMREIGGKFPINPQIDCITYMVGLQYKLWDAERIGSHDPSSLKKSECCWKV